MGGSDVDPGVLNIIVGNAESVHELFRPRFVFHVGFHLEIELGIDGGAVHVEVTTSGNIMT